jgi:uncharacterized membrane protein YdjX (TVP38/TMEM64 family)
MPSARTPSPRGGKKAASAPVRRSPRLATPALNGASGALGKGRAEARAGEAASTYLFLAALGAACVACVGVWSCAPAADRQVCDADLGVGWLVTAVLRGQTESAVRNLSTCARAYDAEHPSWTMLLYVMAYATLQTFAIPGPIVLSLLTGALWSYQKSMVLIGLCATGGASLCFLLSRALRLGSLFRRMDPARYNRFRASVAREHESGNLLYYMLFLRLTPLMPNWFVNLTSPAAGVPLRTFALATAVGLIPANSIHYVSGKTIADAMEAPQNSWQKFALFGVLQIVALVPTFFKSKLDDLEKQR